MYRAEATVLAFTFYFYLFFSYLLLFTLVPVIAHG